MLALILFVFALCYQTQSLSCTAQYQCSTVTTNYNYVHCSSGVCICLTELGFSGNATVSNPCKCSAPYNVYWSASTPYCIDFDDAVSYKLQNAQEQQQIQAVQILYNTILWPTAHEIVEDVINNRSSVISALFASNAIGRVDPIGRFNSVDGIIEYFYGTSWLQDSGITTSMIFKEIFSKNNKVYVQIQSKNDIYNPFTGQYSYSINISQKGRFTFNSDGKIKKLDVIIPYLGSKPDSNIPVDQRPGVIQLLCYYYFQRAGCNSTHDPDGYYADTNECVNYFTNVFDWGTWHDLYFNGNTTQCRFYHTLLAIARPSVHCSHAGKTGGGMCINREYVTYFDEDF